ncbi:MAG: hypothetical protein L6Q81_12645 [Bacteroidia bacterium]|nr:hypothetical protein [Bacteroidia bacterium]
MKTFRQLLVICTLLALSATPALAGLSAYSMKAQGNGIVNGALLEVEDDMFSYMNTPPTNGTWSSEFANYRVNNYVRLKFNESARIHYTAGWTVAVNCQLQKWDATGNAILPNETFTLTLTYNPNAGTQYNDLDQYISSDPGHRTRVTITGVTGAVPSDVMIENIVEVERYYFFDHTAIPAVNHQFNPTNNSLTFYWDYLTGAEEYDLEWTFVSYFDAVQTPDYNRARRVTLSAQNYTINLPFDDGKIFYRVRGVGRFGTDFELREDGSWGTCVSAYTVYNIDPSRNWTYNAVYAEDGKRKEVITFFDGSLRQRQSVTINNSDNVAMQTETFYDYEGRPVIQTLPSPDAAFGSQLKFYTVQSANAGTGYQYNRRDYDRDALFASNCSMSAPVGMSENNGASRYYSPSNNRNASGFNQAIPDANEYPFTQVTYDREGRVKKQTAAGEDFNMGSGHETEYFYANPSQERLDRLFGVEAGEAEHYSLRAAEDANGQLSLAYIDMHGRVVATSLAGAAPSNLSTIEGNSLQTYTQNFATQNYYDPAEEAWIINANLLVTNPGSNYNFTYTLDPQQYEAMCNNSINGECQYDLEIRIFDQCDVPINSTGNISLPYAQTVIGPNNLTYNFTVQFPKVGTYRIEKKLKLSQAAMNAALTAFTNALPGTCINTEASFQSGLYGQYTFDCNDCETWCEQQATAQNLTGEAWTNYVNDCMDDNCNNTITADETNCDAFLNVLKADMSPGGQYYEANNWLYDNLEDTASPYGTGFSWSGFDSYVINTCGLPDPNLTSWAQVDATWNDCYAGYLVQFHPEYCQYTWCTTLETSTVYDIQIFGDGLNDASTLTWAENTNIPNSSPAVVYIDLATSGTVGQNILDNDPFFVTGGPGNAYQTNMQNELDDYQGSSLSMWDYALTLTTCTTACDEQWQAFRALYIGTKQQFVKVLKEANGCYPLHDFSTPVDNIADQPYCSSPLPIQPACNPTGVAGFIIRWPDYTDNLSGIDTQTEADDMANSLADAFELCKVPAYVEIATTSAYYNFDQPTETVLISVNDGTTTVSAMAAPLSMMGNIDGATLVVQLVQAINAHVSVPDYTAAIDPTDPLKFKVYAAASLGATPNGVYSAVITKPGGLSLSAPGKFGNGADNGNCPQNVHCLCGKIDQLVQLWNTSYVDPSNQQTYYYVSHTTYPYEENYVFHILHGIDENVTASMVNNWMDNCTASGGQNPAGEEGTGTYQTLTAGIDCENPPVDCDEDANNLTNFWGTYLYQQTYNTAINNFIIEYKADCWANGTMIDSLSVTYQEREYHYTLYYYDQAGNLTRTVPPSAVTPLNLTASYVTGPNTIGQEITDYRNGISGADYVVPEHSPATYVVGATAHLLVTYYKYNSLNQLEQSTSPDGGTTVYFYDKIGRIVASQNAKQAAASNGGVYYYSYILYDALGRVTESGQVQKSTALTHGTPQDYATFVTWVTTTSSREQVTEMHYDNTLDPTINALFSNGQEFLRKRVATASYERDYDSDPLTYDHATHYSYDVHGNVNTLIQETPELEDLDQRYKYITYNYDLVSGNVHDVHFQNGEADQMHHHYFYDADNRLTNVFTSTFTASNSKATPTTLQGVAAYDQDSKYFYYLHGPMARTEIGDSKVQGLDYAYTINGWIKGVNSNTLVETQDLGKDGTTPTDYSYISSRVGLHSNVARDAYGYVLGYYWDNNGAKDWEPINTSAQSLYSNSNTLSITTDDLFNGNIKEMSTALMKPNTVSGPSAVPVIFNRYHYDQLNRIVSQNSLTHSSNTTTYASHTNTGEYNNTFSYDPNGNIIHQLRNGNNTSGLSMDDLGYNYYANSNKLSHVIDGGTAGNYNDDLETQSSGNYDYTPIGELKSDASEGIDEIIWDINGKIHCINRITGWSRPGSSPAVYPSDLEFKYDAMGNRICKIEKPRDVNGRLNEKDWIYTYYVRDASGNVMAVYNRDLSETGSNYVDQFKVEETYLYGGNRLGLRDYTAQSGVTASVTYVFNGYNTQAGDDYGKFLSGAQVNNSVMPKPSSTAYTRNKGRKVYELANHLGNVLITVSDRKISVDINADNVTNYYLSDVITTSDYSAFGSSMPGRTANANSYRYGFGNNEKDDEITGSSGTDYNFGARIYDARIGKFLSVDPDAVKYPPLSPYCFAANSPVALIDADGRGPKLPTNSDVTWAMFTADPMFFLNLVASNNSSPYDFANWATGKGGSGYGKFKGLMGEVVFYNRLMTTYHMPQVIRRPQGPAIGFYTPDVAFIGKNWTYGGKLYQVDVQTQTRIVNNRQFPSQFNYAYIDYHDYAGASHQDIIGMNEPTGTMITVNYEVKTLSGETDASVLFDQIKTGVQQTIDRGQGDYTYGVLVIDRAAWFKVQNDPVYGPQLREQYERLSTSGNYLRLEDGLSDDANERLFELQEEVQEADN